MDTTMTKDAKKLLCILYKIYRKNIKCGLSKTEAKIMINSKHIHENYLPSWAFADVDDTVRELSRLHLVNATWADNINYKLRLSDVGISYMENRFKNCLKDIVDFLSKLKP